MGHPDPQTNLLLISLKREPFSTTGGNFNSRLTLYTQVPLRAGSHAPPATTTRIKIRTEYRRLRYQCEKLNFSPHKHVLFQGGARRQRQGKRPGNLFSEKRSSYRLQEGVPNTGHTHHGRLGVLMRGSHSRIRMAPCASIKKSHVRIKSLLNLGPGFSSPPAL